jgi:hypothetical protein
MPQWDRWWPLGVAGGLVLLAAAVPFGLLYLALLAGLPGTPPASAAGVNGFAILFWCAPAGGWLLSISRRARQRARACRLAMRGDQSAMALSYISATVLRLPETGDLPVTLAWRHRATAREWGWWLMLALGSSTVVALFIGLQVVFPGDLWSMFVVSAYNTLAEVVTNLLAFAGLMLVTVVAWAGVIQTASDPLGPPYAVRADDTGIRALHALGEGPLMRWSDVRLFEVSNQYGLPTREMFCLYTSDKAVWWVDTEDLENESAAAEVDRLDCQRRLLAMIVERTGMEPRTCTPALMRELSTRHSRWWVHPIRYVLPLALFLISIASLVLPLTPIVALNAYAAATIALVGAVIVWGGRQGREPPAAVPYALTAVPALPEELVVVVYGDAFRRRLQFAGIGLIFLLDAVPAVSAFSNVPAAPTPAFRVQFIAWSLTALAIIGLVVFAIGVLSNRTRLYIESTGLLESEGRTSTWLAWDDIVDLSVKMSQGGPASFTALRRDGKSITWPARNVIWKGSGRTPAPISPDELAAIVAERSDVRLLIE